MMKNTYLFLILIAIVFSSCRGEQKPSSTKKEKKTAKIEIPDFNSDSAYYYIERQVDFGPRVPNTEAHSQCAEYLYDKLNSFSDTTIMQSFKTRAFDGTVLNGKNIIGVFNPEKRVRVLLCAHWDSRPFADYDSDPDNHRTPIDGANDGGSGTGVLLEIARQLSTKKPNVGIDIILFDAEDYGPPQDEQGQTENEDWGLGSQYWARNPHDPDYVARYGILLDMVGTANATFYMEGFSMMYAPGILKKVWNVGHRLGYASYFLFEQYGYINDDHKYVNEIINIPTIDIIHLDSSTTTSSFFEHWHTVGDDMSVIDKETLKVVGQTLLTVIYEEK